MNQDAYEKESLPADYLHDLHAGNIGDVWKHVVYIGLIDQLQKSRAKLEILDTHAGAGGYTLNLTGEWTEGIGALWAKRHSASSGLLQRYFELLKKAGFDAGDSAYYPGSPLIAAMLMRDTDKLMCVEENVETFNRLQAALSKFQGYSIKQGDGLKRLNSLDNDLVLVDPPWRNKSDWTEIPKIVSDRASAKTTSVIALWYPIKSYTRVNAMIRHFRAQKNSFLVADLLSSPIETKHNRLNGSGMIILNPPQNLAQSISEAGAFIGAACKTRFGFWELKLSSFS